MLRTDIITGSRPKKTTGNLINVLNVPIIIPLKTFPVDTIENNKIVPNPPVGFSLSNYVFCAWLLLLSPTKSVRSELYV